MAPSYSEDRRTALCEWLTANGVEPKNVPINSDLTIATDEHGARTVHYEEYALDSTGSRYIDERLQHAARVRRSAPLVAEPPEWWEPYEKPSREQLLESVDRVRALHRKNENTGDCEYCSARDYPNYSVPHPCDTIQALEEKAGS